MDDRLHAEVLLLKEMLLSQQKDIAQGCNM